MQDEVSMPLSVEAVVRCKLETCLLSVAAAVQAAVSPAADLRNDTRGHLRSVLPAAAAVRAAPIDVF